MAAVTGADVAAFLEDAATEAVAVRAVQAVTMIARAYTRGEGFDDDVPNDEIAAAILTAAARLARNPGGLSYSESMGPFAQDVRGAFAGFTLAELAALDRYRVHAL